MRSAALAAGTVAASALSVLVISAASCGLPTREEFANGKLSTDATSTSSSGTIGEAGPGPLVEGGLTSSSSSSGTVDARVPFVCPPNALLCDDFETGNVTAQFGKSTGKASIIAGGYSSDHALLTTFSNGQAGDVESNLPTQGAVMYSFWFRTDGPPPTDVERFRIAQLLFGPPCDWPITWEAYFQSDGLYQGAESYNANTNPSCGPIKYGSKILLTASEAYDKKWHHVVVTIDGTKTLRTTSAVADDHAPVTDSVDSGRETIPATLDVGLGLSCVNDTGGCFDWRGPDFTVYFDQAVLTLPSP